MASSDARAATIGGVGTKNQERADRVIERRKRLGYFTPNSFVTASGIGRDKIKSVEAGLARDASYDEVEAWLDAAEADRGLPALAPTSQAPGPADDPQLVTFRIRGNFGVDVTVQGPVTSAEELEPMVARLMDRAARTGSEDEPED